MHAQIQKNVYNLQQQNPNSKPLGFVLNVRPSMEITKHILFALAMKTHICIVKQTPVLDTLYELSALLEHTFSLFLF
jgi:hypothetical protein